MNKHYSRAIKEEVLEPLWIISIVLGPLILSQCLAVLLDSVGVAICGILFGVIWVMLLNIIYDVQQHAKAIKESEAKDERKLAPVLMLAERNKS